MGLKPSPSGESFRFFLRWQGFGHHEEIQVKGNVTTEDTEDTEDTEGTEICYGVFISVLSGAPGEACLIYSNERS